MINISPEILCDSVTLLVWNEMRNSILRLNNPSLYYLMANVFS